MLVIYDFDSNNLLLGPLKNRKLVTIKTAWYLINDTLSNGGVIPKLYILDHEESIKLKTATTKINKSSFSPSAHPPQKCF